MTAGRPQRSRKPFPKPSFQRTNSDCSRSRACPVALRARPSCSAARGRVRHRCAAGAMARRRRIIAAAALVCTSALVPLQAPRPRRTVSRYSEAVDEDTLLPSGDAQAPETDRRPRNGNRQNQGGGRGRIIQLSNPMRLVRKQRPGGDRRGPPRGRGGQPSPGREGGWRGGGAGQTPRRAGCPRWAPTAACTASQ